MKMRKTKIKFMSLLLAVMMIVGMLPTTVFAAGEITTGNAKVTAPVAGQTPSFTATSDEPEKYSVELLSWIDVENSQNITPTDLTDPGSYYYNYTFKGGKEYTAIVRFTAVGGNTLSYDNSFTINGETTYWTGNGLKRCHTFTATGTGGGEGTKVYSATVADINITLPAGYTSNDINNLGEDRTIKFTNTGTETLYISNPTLSGTNASDFSVRIFGKLVVAPGNTNTTAYAIEPNIGLDPGTYTATISCTDDDNKLSAPVTATVTLTVSDHNWDTSKWEFNSLTHWHKCTDSGCSAKGDEAAHNSDKVVGVKSATFDTDGYTGDKYCSICDRKMETGKAIVAGKYIRESKATMTPAGIDNTISANDLVFTSLDTSKYTVGLYRVFDMTDTTLNTVGSTYKEYPHDKKFISGHKYAIEFEFEAVDPYVYDTMHSTHISTFKLNDADTMMSAAITFAGSPKRRVELVAGGVSVATYDLTTSVNGGHGTISAGENGITEGTSKIITFTPDSGYEIDKVMVNGTETTVTGNTLTVTMDGNKNVVVTYKAIEYTITVTDGKATVGAGSEISKAAQGTIVTLTANAAPSGKVFDKWVVVSGGITLADANSATTTFTMPAEAVSVKATYKNAPPTPTPTPTHTHNLTLVAAKAATCTEGGKEAYYKCEGCGKFYEDVLGTKEITDLASWGNIAKIAHTTKLNATSLTYNGKVRTPKVIVKDRTGKTLVKNTDYTVSYAKGRKYVGKYAVKITFKGKYSGTKTLYFTIKPKATSISSLTAGSKKFTVKWKKQATQTTGYQVQYSASSKFSKAKTVTVGKNTTVSKKISKLSGKKKYYVRVRTYKTVKINGKSIRIYSGWSKAKTVTTKK